jgi:ArsR family transcriptional regulator
MGIDKTAQGLIDQFSATGRLLNAIGDETRQRIIAVLAASHCEGVSVSGIKQQTHLSRPAVSHHLKILLDAEVIGMSPVGTTHLYYLKLGGEWKTLVELINNIERLREHYMREQLQRGEII